VSRVFSTFWTISFCFFWQFHFLFCDQNSAFGSNRCAHWRVLASPDRLRVFAVFCEDYWFKILCIFLKFAERQLWENCQWLLSVE